MAWSFKLIQFNPTEHFGQIVKGFCKSPQVVKLNQKNRIYCCVAIGDGSYLKSIPVYIDFDVGFNRILDVSGLDILSESKLGTFDENGIFPFSPFQNDNKFYAFTTGWSRRQSVDIDLSIGLVESDDNGKSFNRKFGSGPIMTANVNEPFLVGDAFVRKFEGIFRMWYIYGSKWCAGNNGEHERHYKIAYATSEDLIEWQRSSEYCFKGYPNRCEALPSVVKFRGRYHMIFCQRKIFTFRHGGPAENAYKLTHAISDDLETWIELPNSFRPSYSNFDDHMQCYPYVFINEDRLSVMYNGNHFGYRDFGLLTWED